MKYLIILLVQTFDIKNYYFKRVLYTAAEVSTAAAYNYLFESKKFMEAAINE